MLQSIARLVLIAAMRLVLFQPDIPQNAGNLLRLCACLGVGVDLIEPLCFVFGCLPLRRARMDCLAAVEPARHASWSAFLASKPPSARLLLVTTQGELPYWQCR